MLNLSNPKPGLAPCSLGTSVARSLHPWPISIRVLGSVVELFVEQPYISVIIPTCRRDHLLLRALTALCLQEFPADEYEIVVADDAVSEETRRLVEAMAASSRCALRYVPVLGKHGPAAARNCGWREARGELLAFTNEDCIADPLWLPLGVKALCQKSEPDAVWGKLIDPAANTNSDCESNAARPGKSVLIAANCFVKRQALALVGGFDEHFRLASCEDTDLYFRMLEHGMSVEHVSNAVVVRGASPIGWVTSLSHQAKRQFDMRLYRKHPRLYRQHIAPFPFVYMAIVACGAGALVAAIAGASDVALLLAVFWVWLTLRLMFKRFMQTNYAVHHRAETALISIVIPWLATYYRAVGWWPTR